MANELYLEGDPTADSGLTITAKVYTLLGVQVGSDVSCTEVGSLAFYTGDMPTAAAGSYLVRFFAGAAFKGSEVFSWDGSARITLATMNNLNAQQVRDAIDLNHTDGTAGAGPFLKVLQALILRRR